MNPRRVATAIVAFLAILIVVLAGLMIDPFGWFDSSTSLHANPSIGIAPPQDIGIFDLLEFAKVWAGARSEFIGVIMALATLLGIISAIFVMMGESVQVVEKGVPVNKPNKIRGLGIAFGIFAAMLPTMIFMNALSNLAGWAFQWSSFEELAAFIIGGLLMVGVAIIVSAVVQGDPKIVYGLLFIAVVFTGAKYWSLTNNPHNLIGQPNVEMSQQHTAPKWAWWKLDVRHFPIKSNGDLVHFKPDTDGNLTKESNGRLCPGAKIINDPTTPDGSVYYLPYNHGNAVHQLAYECASANYEGVVTDECWNWMEIEFKAVYGTEMPVDEHCKVADVPAKAPSTASPTSIHDDENSSATNGLQRSLMLNRMEKGVKLIREGKGKANFGHLAPGEVFYLQDCYGSSTVDIVWGTEQFIGTVTLNKMAATELKVGDWKDTVPGEAIMVTFADYSPRAVAYCRGDLCNPDEVGMECPVGTPARAGSQQTLGFRGEIPADGLIE